MWKLTSKHRTNPANGLHLLCYRMHAAYFMCTEAAARVATATTEDQWRRNGEAGSLESNCNKPGTHPEQMAGRDVWRGRVHLTSRCQTSPPRFEQYSYKRQCGIDGFIKVSLHSETFTAAAATWRNKGQSVCEEGDAWKRNKNQKPAEWFPANPIIDKAAEPRGTRGKIRGECLVIGATGGKTTIRYLTVQRLASEWREGRHLKIFYL